MSPLILPGDQLLGNGNALPVLPGIVAAIPGREAEVRSSSASSELAI